MTTLVDGLNLKLREILNGNNSDIHGHEITFEKTGGLEYSSIYFINCNRRYIIDLSSVTVTVKEVIVPDDEVVYVTFQTLKQEKGNKHQTLRHHQNRNKKHISL